MRKFVEALVEYDNTMKGDSAEITQAIAFRRVVVEALTEIVYMVRDIRTQTRSYDNIHGG